MLNFHSKCRKSLFSKVEGSAQPSLNADKVLGTLLPIPSMQDQKRIVELINNLQKQLDGLRYMHSESKAELDALFPAILNRAFTGQL
jgi:type I restriction enzyme S subunit